MSLPLPTKPPNGSTINTGHSIASGLQRCILLNEGSGSPRELVGGAFGTLVGTAAFSTDTNLGGTCINIPNAGDGINWTANGLSYGNGNCTVFFSCNVPTNAAAEHMIAEAAGGSTDGIFFGINDSGDWRFVLADVFIFDRAVAALNVGHVYSCAMIFTRGTSVRFYFKDQTNDTTGDTTVNDASTPVPSANPSTLGIRRDLSNGTFKEKIAHLYMWNRALSTGEIDTLFTNPYVFINSGTDILWMPSQQIVRPRNTWAAVSSGMTPPDFPA